MKNSDMPVMPSGQAQNGHYYGFDPVYPGLTKREMFAMHAMSAMLSSKYPTDFNDGEPDENINLCSKAVKYADALLAELESESQPRKPTATNWL